MLIKTITAGQNDEQFFSKKFIKRNNHCLSFFHLFRIIIYLGSSKTGGNPLIRSQAEPFKVSLLNSMNQIQLILNSNSTKI